jgi:uncharacterized protein (UPF0248 family)
LDDDVTSDVTKLFSHLSAGKVESSLQFVSRLASWEAIEGGREGNRRIVAQIRLSGASVPLHRIRERRAATIELYGLEYEGNLKLDREAFRGLASGTNARSDQILNALPPPLRGYHKSLINAGWSYQTRRGKEAGFQLYFANGVEDLSERLDRNSRLVTRIPLHRIVSGQAAEMGNYSFLRILAVIGDLLDLLQKPDSDRRDRIAEILQTGSQARSYPTPVAVQGGRTEAADEVDDDDSPADHDPLAFHDGWYIEDVLNNWLSDHAERDGLGPLAPIALSRMWTRFTYTFQNIRENLIHGVTRYLGVLMHRSVIAFLHSVGYEAMRAANAEPRGSLGNNPVNSGEITVGLLIEIYDNPENEKFRSTAEFAFFDLIFTCPLWAYFLARDETDEVAKPRRLRPNNRILEAYEKRSSSYWSKANAEFSSVELHSSGAETAANFHGLYFPLNTVQLQGQAPQNRRFGQTLASAIKPRTRSRSGTAADATKPDTDAEPETP